MTVASAPASSSSAVASADGLEHNHPTPYALLPPVPLAQRKQPRCVRSMIAAAFTHCFWECAWLGLACVKQLFYPLHSIKTSSQRHAYLLVTACFYFLRSRLLPQLLNYPCIVLLVTTTFHVFIPSAMSLWRT